MFKTHLDLGFTDLCENVVRNVFEKFIPQVDRLYSSDSDNEYVWTAPSWPVYKALEMASSDPEKLKTAEALVNKGRLVWHALPFTTHTEFCSLEELIYAFAFAEELSLRYGKRPVSAKMTDVPGHTFVLPTLLNAAGIHMLHLGCNPGSTPPDVPGCFWWEGPDGGRVLTFYSKGQYGSALTPPDDWKYPVWLSLVLTNDNMGPHEAGIIEQIKKEIRQSRPDAEVIFGTMDDFFHEFVKHDLNLPVIKKDLADSWIHGAGTYPAETSSLRRNRNLLKTAEAIHSYLDAAGIKKLGYETECRIFAAYENALLFCEHTWGLDVKEYMKDFRHYTADSFAENRSSGIYKYMERSWDEQRERVLRSCAETEKLLKDAGSCLRGDSNKTKYVFNHTGAGGDKWVKLDLPGKKLFDTRNDTEILLQNAPAGPYGLIKNLPPFGAVVLKEGDSLPVFNGQISTETTNETFTVENTYNRLVIDRRDGRITALVDKASGHQWIESGTNENGYRYDIFGKEDIERFYKEYVYQPYDWIYKDLGRIGYPDCVHETFRPVFYGCSLYEFGDHAILETEWTPQSESTEQYGDCRRIKLQIIMYTYIREIDFIWHIKDKQATSMIEAAHVVFPLAISSPKIRINKTGSVVDPVTDIVDNANHCVYCLDSWVDFSDAQKGITFVSHDCPLFSIGDMGLYRFRKRYKEAPAHIYFNLYNTIWGTNFPQWIEGDFNFKFSVITHSGAEDSRRTRRYASLLRQELLCFDADDSVRCRLPGSFLYTTDNIRLVLFNKSKRQEGSFFIVLQEFMGEDGGYAEIYGRTVPCNLMEEPLPPVENKHISLDRYAIKAFLADF